MEFHVITIFPEFFTSPLSVSLLKKAQDKGVVSCTVHNLRDYATGPHRSTDDAPYGGGRGMVMKPEPIVAALEGVCRPLPNPWRILLSPQGVPLTQVKVAELAGRETLVLLCGRYEGVDERVRTFVDEEISIGDYVLSGGEVAALVIIDAAARLVPGVVGRKESTEDESFSDGLLEYPQYTRPEEFRGLRVPEVLLSGNHAEITGWRRRQALLRTRERRPDLLARATLSTEDERWLAQESDE
ncbi:MAG: tRNA (guanosine(37)-N1)-methyltransferase TrmD [Deltaproteobacteria bacterium]|nr:tRNA (guanosine(37)-N1)-methyltransferase TrmD [Deltaproteobacteria bacterium]